MAVFFVPIVAGLLLVAVLLATLLAIYQRTYWRRRCLLHIDCAPILGMNSPVFLKHLSFPEHALKLYETHPGARYYGAFDFNTPVLVLKDPRLVRDLCVKHFDSFTDHRSFVTEEMDPIVGRNVFSLKGQRWRIFRSALSPSFSSKKMRIMFRLMSECSSEFVRYFLEYPELAESFEAKDSFTRYTNDMIATAAFGIRVNSMRDKENEFYMYGKDATSFSSFLRLLKYMLLRVFPRLVHLTGERFLSRSTNRFFNELVRSTVRTRDERGIVRPDMIQLLMQERDRENGIDVSMDDIVGQAFIFFLAGFETASTAMCFAAYELAAHPDVQDKVRKEIDEQLEADGEVTYDSLSRMTYLEMVLSEVLRKNPPVPMTDRVCTEEFVLPPARPGDAEYRVEVGTNVVMPIFGFHHDPKYFPEPEKFDPERFSEENKERISPYTYIPFGIGPRKCIGTRFALMETKTLLVHILKNFTIKLTNKSRYPVVFCKKNFNVTIDGGYWLRFERRKKTD